jgi:hypothetical protein
MVDSVSNNGGVKGFVPTKTDPAVERQERKAEQDKADQARDQDKVEISERAQSLAQIEDTAKLARYQIEKSDQPLSGGRVDALV